MDNPSPSIERIEVGAYTIPTDAPEADGTLAWDSTTIVVVHVHAGGVTGLGYTYADVSTAKLIETKLAGVVQGGDAHAPRQAWSAMVRTTRNLGRPGITSMAISAVDVALWDLHARLLGAPLARVLGAGHDHVPVYGSGGFTAYSNHQLAEQLAGWVDGGIPRVKMKIGTRPADDPERVRVARDAIGAETELFVDANGAYSRKQALALAAVFAEQSGVSWFEEPVSSDDLAGLRLVRDRAPAGMDVAAGEGRCDLPRAQPAAVAALRSGDPRPCGDRARAAAPPGVLPRPRADRATAVRWPTGAPRRGVVAGSGPARNGSRAQARRRRGLRRVKSFDQSENEIARGMP